MSSPQSSCLVQKLEKYIPLDADNRKLLAALEQTSREYARAKVLRRGGDEITRLYVVGSGWLFSYTTLTDGRRHVLQLHYPGDIIGIEHLPFVHATHDLQTATDVTVCPFEKRSLDEILVKSPRLSALLWSFSIIEHSTLMDRIRVLGRMNAVERLAHLLLEIASRLRLTGALESDGSFELPLNQTVLGDAIGLTNVYVSRTMRRLVDTGLVRRDGHRVTIEDWDALTELAEFHDRFESIDTRWFPGSED